MVTTNDDSVGKAMGSQRKGLVSAKLKASAVRMDATRRSAKHPRSIEELFPPHDFGGWPEGFSASREQIYGDEGR